MINCNNCNNSINRSMKHSMKSNECPFCGSTILNNEDLKKCKDISYDLLSAGFKESDVYEISIFIYNKYLKKTHFEGTDDEYSEFYEENDAEPKADSEEIKLKDLEEEGLGSEQEEYSDEEDGDRVSRLRTLARNNPILNKKGASVRRVSD